MKKVFITIFIVFLVAIIGVVGVVTLSGYVEYKKAISNVSLENAVNEIREEENYVTTEKMNKDFKAAIVAIEDHRFYSHSGIDIISTGHAIWVNIISGSFDYGASGITQQVGRLLYFTQERSIIRKVSELFVALDLEKNYSKEEILELYVNMSYYGEGYYGIGEASKGFFDKSPSELTFEESTYLAGVPNAPSIYSTNKELGEERRLQVVNALEKYKDEVFEE